MCEFARQIGEPFDPFQEWLAIHVGELLPDGRPRFRVVLVLVARQNGKTHFLKVLILWWLFVDLPGTRMDKPTVLGTSSKLEYAKETWHAAVDTAKRVPMLAEEIAPRGIQLRNGEESFTTVHNTRYKIAASNDDAGRSLTVDRLGLDELRKHQDWTAWNAAEPTTNSVDNAQIVCLSNQGDRKAVVLRSLRKSALEFIDSGEGDPRLGLFEWSSPDGADPEDPVALAAANPNFNRRWQGDSLLGAAKRAKAAGGDQLTGFKIEYMCMEVPVLNPAVDPVGWKAGLDPGDMANLRDQLAACVDVSLDGQHACLVVAAVLPEQDDEAEVPSEASESNDDPAGGQDEGTEQAPAVRVRVEAVKAWSGPNCTREMRRDLPGLLRRIRPRVFGWFPSGPAAAVAADLADPKHKRVNRQSSWPPAGVRVEAIRQEVPAVCMGFADLVKSGGVVHSGDPMIDKHVLGAEKLLRGSTFVFTHKGPGHINGAYAAAGAVHLARTLPPMPPRPKVISSKRNRDRRTD
ncbi:terminase [Actinophytocola xinjiangensis]|uniref:terminase n=1 Tax=Actinophytocola xinjiangensis TaxID=485602 RepID=UPI000A407DD4|nr:terminase [Actinophytocola xinjiangensis]